MSSAQRITFTPLPSNLLSNLSRQIFASSGERLPPCGDPLLRPHHNSVLHYAALQIFLYEVYQPLVLNILSEHIHKQLMAHGVNVF